MAVSANTTLANTIVIKWDQDTLEARYANAVIMPRVLNKSALVRDFGDRVEINIEPNFSTGTVTAATGAFTASNNACSNVNIICNIWSYCAESTTDQARIQSFWTAENGFAKNAGRAFAKDYDSNIAGLHASISTLTPVGDELAPEDFGKEAASIAMLRLADANIPLVNLSFILPPIAYFKGWVSDSQLTAANSMGVPKNVLTTGYQSNIFGHPMYLSTVLSKSSNNAAYKGLLLHKECIGVAFQQNVTYKLIDNSPAGALTHTALATSLWGKSVIRSNHGIVINVKAS